MALDCEHNACNRALVCRWPLRRDYNRGIHVSPHGVELVAWKRVRMILPIDDV